MLRLLFRESRHLLRLEIDNFGWWIQIVCHFDRYAASYRSAALAMKGNFASLYQMI